ncbi:MAG TPA: YihY/virulence factor BrkB family protein [Gemmatimonadales bacterium]|nr:YihY/virulence factor BrkB family protein [Gemmatimonadales bacterium]
MAVDTLKEKARLATPWGLVKAAASTWWSTNAPRMGAALSFYTLFSLAPVLIVVIAIAGLVFGEEAARGELVRQFGDLVGTEGAEAVGTILSRAREPGGGGGPAATVLGAITFFFGATGVFAELHGALNTIWDARPKPGSTLLGLLRERLLSFGAVVGLGFLLLVSLVVSTALAALGSFVAEVAPDVAGVMQVLNALASFAVVTVIFALIFRVLPDVRLAWRDIWIGAAFTSALFTLGKLLIGLYLGQGTITSTYGAAGAVVALLVWVYYSSLIVLFGAAFTLAYASWVGSHARRQETAAGRGL